MPWFLSHASGMRLSCQSHFFWLWALSWLWKKLLWWQGHWESYTVFFLQGWEASRQASVHTWDVPSTASLLLDKVFHSSSKTICSAYCPDLEQGEEMGCTISVVTQKCIEGEQSPMWGHWPLSWRYCRCELFQFSVMCSVLTQERLEK